MENALVSGPVSLRPKERELTLLQREESLCGRSAFQHLQKYHKEWRWGRGRKGRGAKAKCPGLGGHEKVQGVWILPAR